MDPLLPQPLLAESIRLAVARARGSVLGRLPARQEEPSPPPSGRVDEQRLDRLRLLNGQLRGAGSVVHELADDLPPIPESTEPIALTDEEQSARTDALRNRLLKRRLEDLQLSLAETFPFRVRVAWRIVRELARLKNLVQEDELLIDMELDPERDPWSAPIRGRAPASKTWARRLDATLLRALEVSARSGLNGEGAPLLPPSVGGLWRTPDGLVRDDYDPGQDADLRAFLRAAGLVAGHYCMADFETERGAEGELGLEGMLDVDTARLCWPSRSQIMAFEELVVGEAREFLATKGLSQARKHLVLAHGLRPREIDSIIKVAASSAVALTDFSPEEQRALMILRIDDYITRAREELNMAGENRGHKLMILVQGLAKIEQANPYAEFSAAVESARALESDSDDIPELEVIDVPALPPPPETRP